MELGLQVRESGGWVIVAVEGDVDLTSAPALRQRLHAVVAAGTPNVVVDLDGVEFLDSTGLGVLVGALRRSRQDGGDLRLVCSVSRLRQVFEVTRLDRAFVIVDSVADAVTAS